MATISFEGETKQTTLKIPGWGGNNTDNGFQPWHYQPFAELAETGMEISFPYEDIHITTDNCPKPFVSLSEHFYQLELEIFLSSSGMLLILPHYRFYTDHNWTTPLPVACSLGGWWPMPLSIIFKHLPNGTTFKKNEPIAQIIPIDKKCHLVNMSEEQKKEKEKAIKLVKGVQPTRKWITSTGVTQDNVYNILSQLDKDGRLTLRKTTNLKLVK